MNRAPMADIFNEIDEDIRRERLGRLWKRVGPYAIALAILIVAAIAGWRGWEYYVAKRSAESGLRYEAALSLAREGKHQDAEAALKAIEADAPAGYSLLARFRAATELARTDGSGSVSAFEAISQDSSVSPLLRDMARIRAALILIDTGSQADVVSRVQALAVPGNAWRHSARELMALAAWKAGDIAETRRWAQEVIGDVEAPAGSRARAQLLLDLAAGAEAPPATPAAPAP